MTRKHPSTRRDFLKTTAATGFGYWVGTSPLWSESRSPNEKLNIGKIGAGGKGIGDTFGISSENIVAFAEVDMLRAAPTFKNFPGRKIYHDYRTMLEKEKLDAVHITTPDHMHAPMSLMAMRMGLHVYCQKPMCVTVDEARLMKKIAAETGVVTQMGNQSCSSPTMRRAVELVQSGIIGTVKEAHVWTNRPIWPQGGQRPSKPMPIPGYLYWDHFLGVAPERPYHEVYLPFKWRGWRDFGVGALGDMGCHNLNLPHWALKLNAPEVVEIEQTTGLTEEMWPKSTQIRYDFPARGDLPPVTLRWYDGDYRPPRKLLEGLPAEEKIPTNGVLLIGSKGQLYAPSSHCRIYEWWPHEEFAHLDTTAPPEILPRSPGHSKEWISACKGGPKTSSPLDGRAAALTETVLLGTVALRAGEAIHWDPVKAQVTNVKRANEYLGREYRGSWMS